MTRNPPAAPTPIVDAAQALASTGDRVGMVGSLLCALHCALLPLAIAVLPALGLGGFALVDLDQAFTIFATGLGVTMLAFGYRRHRAFQAWMVLIPGLALIWLGSFTALHTHSFAHTAVMVSGGFAVAFAHLLNLKLTHRATRSASGTGADRTRTA